MSNADPESEADVTSGGRGNPAARKAKLGRLLAFHFPLSQSRTLNTCCGSASTSSVVAVGIGETTEGEPNTKRNANVRSRRTRRER
jgi:hypothetical protein